MPVKTDTFLDMEEISSYVDKIKTVYEADAYYSAEVTPVIQLISEDQAVLTFLIKEGSALMSAASEWREIKRSPTKS